MGIVTQDITTENRYQWMTHLKQGDGYPADLLERLGNTSKKKGIFGAGDYAFVLYKKLAGYSVAVDFLTVEDSYYHTPECTWGGGKNIPAFPCQ